MRKSKRAASAVMAAALAAACFAAAPDTAEAAYTSPTGSFTFTRTPEANESLSAMKEDLNADAAITVLSPNMEVLNSSKVHIFLMYKYPYLYEGNFATGSAEFSAAGTKTVKYASGRATKFYHYVSAGSVAEGSYSPSVTVRYYYKP